MCPWQRQLLGTGRDHRADGTKSCLLLLGRISMALCLFLHRNLQEPRWCFSISFGHLGCTSLSWLGFTVPSDSAGLGPTTIFSSHGEEEKPPLSLLATWLQVTLGFPEIRWSLLLSLVTGDLSAWLLLSSPCLYCGDAEAEQPLEHQDLIQLWSWGKFQVMSCTCCPSVSGRQQFGCCEGYTQSPDGMRSTWA